MAKITVQTRQMHAAECIINVLHLQATFNVLYWHVYSIRTDVTVMNDELVRMYSANKLLSLMVVTG